MKDRIIIFVAPSSSGKDYLMNEYLKTHPNAERVVTCTTRPMRSNETNHVDYHFITDDEFDVLKLTGKLIEHREYHVADGSIWKYGCPYFINEWCHEYVNVMDLSGCEAICKAYPEAEVIVKYVYAPEDIRRKRAEGRDKNFDINEWNRRLKTDEEDFSYINLAKLNAILLQYGNLPITTIDNY